MRINPLMLIALLSTLLLTACFGNFGCGFSKSAESECSGRGLFSGSSSGPPWPEKLQPSHWPYALPRGGVYIYAYTSGLQDDFKDIVPVNLSGSLIRLRDVPGEEVSAALWEELDKEVYKRNKSVKSKKPDHDMPVVYNESWQGDYFYQTLPRIIASIPGDSFNRPPPQLVIIA